MEIALDPNLQIFRNSFRWFDKFCLLVGCVLYSNSVAFCTLRIRNPNSELPKKSLLSHNITAFCKNSRSYFQSMQGQPLNQVHVPAHKAYQQRGQLDKKNKKRTRLKKEDISLPTNFQVKLNSHA